MNSITNEIQWLSDLTADNSSSEVDSVSQLNEQQSSIAREGENDETEVAIHPNQQHNQDNDNNNTQTQTIWESEGGPTKTLRRSSRI